MPDIDSTVIRAAQITLTAHGFAVAMDGIFGPGTRKALQQFQQSRKLPPTGELDAGTLKALGLAGKPAETPNGDHVRAIERAVNSGMATPEQAKSLVNALTTHAGGRPALATEACPVNLIKAVCIAMKRERSRWEAVKAAVVRVATEEFHVTWNNGTKRETEAAMHAVIESYWRDGVYSDTAIPASIQIPQEEWSGAFIAWVVQQAGGGDRFSKAGGEATYRAEWRPRAHWRYVAPSKFNRENNSGVNPFWAFAIDEEKPQAGDIVVKSRGNSGATYANFTSRISHGDIVVEVGANNVNAIGGNVGGTVASSTFALNASRLIASTGGGNDDHYAIVRINTAMFDLQMCDLLDRGLES